MELQDRNDELQETVNDLRLQLFRAQQNSARNPLHDQEDRCNEVAELHETISRLHSQAKEDSMECDTLRELASAAKLQIADESVVCAELEQTNESMNEQLVQQNMGVESLRLE